MKSEYLFVIAGAAALCLAMALRIRNPRRSGWGDGVTCLLWACFGVGLMIQGCAPNLQIERDRFLITTSSAARTSINPMELVKRERQMQTLSALLTGGAALGLALCHRALFSRPVCRQDSKSSVRMPASS
jgi:hypothetical protein